MFEKYATWWHGLKERVVFFLYSFEKNVRANINLNEEQALKELAKVYFELTDTQINLAILKKELVEVKDG